MIDMPPDCSHWDAKLRAAREPAAFTQAFEGQLECQRLAEAGWSPLAQVAKQGREARRVSFRDGRLAFRIPSVALERREDGRVFLSMSARGAAGLRRAEVPREAWDQTAGFKAEVGVKLPQRAWRKGDPIPPMHCTRSILEEAAAGKAARREVSECDPRDRQALGLAYRVAALAVTHIPECAAAREKAARETPAPRPDPAGPDDAPMWTLLECGGRFQPHLLPMG